MHNKLRKALPYLMIVLLIFVTHQYSYIFTNFNFNGFYGKYVDLDAYNFRLTNVFNKEITLRDFKGQFILLTFGFTKCTEICPENLYRFQAISEQISKNKKLKVKFIFISFDNIRDTNADIKDFLENFKIPNLYGLTDGKETGQFVARQYHSYIPLESQKIKKDPNHQIRHKGFIYLINPMGRLSVIYMQKKLEEEKIINDIMKLKNKV